MKTPMPFTLFAARPATPDGEAAEPDFDLVSRYFYKNSREERALQFIDAETASDLDLNEVFARIDRTRSRIGQQCLYARLRTLRGAADAERFGRRVEFFRRERQRSDRCAKTLARLTGEENYHLQNLIFDAPVPIRRIGMIYLLTAAAVASLVGSIFQPALLFLFGAIYAVNLYLHFSHKLDISVYVLSVGQLRRVLRTARSLCAEQVPGTDEAAAALRGTARVVSRSRMLGIGGNGGNELAAVAGLLLEMAGIAVNAELILYHRLTGCVTQHRDDLHDLFRYIGESDAALSVAHLRDETPHCTPQFVEGKYFEIRDAVHPLIADCVANTLLLDGTGLLLTGSNMAGKTTFIRTLMLDALFAQTIHTCFASEYKAPYMRLFSSIRIADDIGEGTSYFLQEVRCIKRHLDAAAGDAPCLFALDELFKGTNTTERIAAGKAVLARLNRGPHVVLVSTHDIELAELLAADAYCLYHFREEIAQGRLVFDYRLHAGPLTTRNAIRILELNDYPTDVIAEAYATQEVLTRNSR